MGLSFCLYAWLYCREQGSARYVYIIHVYMGADLSSIISVISKNFADYSIAEMFTCDLPSFCFKGACPLEYHEISQKYRNVPKSHRRSVNE